MKFLTVYNFDYYASQGVDKADRVDIRASTVVAIFANNSERFPTQVITDTGGSLTAYMTIENLDAMKAILEAAE